MEKLFFKSDSIFFMKDTVDTSSLGDENPMFTRQGILVNAHIGVNAEDILAEVQDIEDRMERGELPIGPLNSPILTTTITESTDLVVALTYIGFTNVANSLIEIPLRRDRYRALAIDLVRRRDRK